MTVELSKNKNKAIKRIINTLLTEPLKCQYCPVGCEFSELSCKTRKEKCRRDLCRPNAEHSCFTLCSRRKINFLIKKFIIKKFTIRQYIYRCFLENISCSSCLVKKLKQETDISSCITLSSEMRNTMTTQMEQYSTSCMMASTYILGKYLQKNHNVLQPKEKK